MAVLVSYKLTIRAYQSSNTGRPHRAFTLRQVERSFNETVLALERHSVLAFSSTGAQAEIILANGDDNAPYATRVVTLPRDLQIVKVVDRIKAKTMTLLSRESAQDYLTVMANSTCQDPRLTPRTLVGQQVLLSYTTYGYSMNATNEVSDGEVDTFTYWYAPDLDCIPLKQTFEWTYADGRKGKSEKVVTSVVLGEPNTALFVVPPEYRELPPSALGLEQIRSTSTRAIPDKVMESLRRRDQRYYENQSKLGVSSK